MSDVAERRARRKTPAQAIGMFHELRPEVVTLDAMMPEVDGYDSLRVFRQMRIERPEVAIIAVSAVAFGKIRYTFLTRQALVYVDKPFKQFSFKLVLRRQLRVFRQDVARAKGDAAASFCPRRPEANSGR